MKRQIIGVVSTRTADTEQRELLRGIIPAAWKRNTDVVVISNIYNPEYDDDINNILNLNTVSLMNQRKSAFDGLLQRMASKKNGAWKKEYIERREPTRKKERAKEKKN